jgi:protein SCO1
VSVRLRRLLQAAAILLLVGLVALFAKSLRDSAGTVAAAVRDGQEPAAPDFTRDHLIGDGTVSLRDYRGQVVVLTFLYTTCRDTCPLTATQIRGALDDLGRDVPALAVSVDPANDTPERARRFLFTRGLARDRMRFLLGTRAQLEPVWKAYGIRPQGEAFDHSAYVLLIDRRGRQRIGFPVQQLTPEALAHDIRRLQAEA